MLRRIYQRAARRNGGRMKGLSFLRTHMTWCMKTGNGECTTDFRFDGRSTERVPWKLLHFSL